MHFPTKFQALDMLYNKTTYMYPLPDKEQIQKIFMGTWCKVYIHFLRKVTVLVAHTARCPVFAIKSVPLIYPSLFFLKFNVTHPLNIHIFRWFFLKGNSGNWLESLYTPDHLVESVKGETCAGKLSRSLQLPTIKCLVLPSWSEGRKQAKASSVPLSVALAPLKWLATYFAIL